MTDMVQIVEVGPRDGLQNEKEVIGTADKLTLIGRMIDAGVRRVEVASFVNPARVPQMADGEAVIAALPDRRDVSYIGLCLNKRGVLRAIESRQGGRRGVDEAGCVVVASDSFGQRNQGQTIVQGIEENRAMLRLAASEGLVPQVTISAAFGCPFEGAVPVATVIDIAREMAAAGAVEIALADTIGVAVPAQVADLFGRLAESAPGVRMRAHFHDTRGTGIANAWAAYQAGVRVLDTSLGGLGGCPFAPNATGNIATEDLLFLLDRSGVATGVDIDQAIAANRWFATVLGRPLPSMVAKAGNYTG
ncbi:hydroxymethylglutaryl-CoA lyase [Glacieibacterium sp.]|uniref:hydroxymethylglutaryl-CoA lyase n=1 Tax=Glacieibacterium sp. TaxID=2860237 RepID=UPI003AFFA35C